MGIFAFLVPIGRAFFGSMIGRIVAASIIGLLALKGYGLYERRQGATEAIASVNKQTDALTKEAVKERKKADQPGSAERLRKSYCRDC